MDAALRALNRFGMGARVGDRRGIGEPRRWLLGQLADAPPLRPEPTGVSTAELLAVIEAFRRAGQGRDQDARRQARRQLRQVWAAEARAALEQRLTSERPFVERLVAFWANHLCVSTRGEPLVEPLAGSYEREVVRPHVLGRFSDMVLASARHPAMLVYLDNFQSVGPGSPGAAALGRRGNAARGLNENYARELLELHTLGVDGGYTQDDVVSLARMLTGWTVDGLLRGPAAGGRRGRSASAAPETPLGFRFQGALHEPGDKTLLGVRYDEAGVREGERAIAALCRHPATATFVATKLVRHFVADTPPPRAVAALARVFADSDGDLREMAEALVGLPEAWDAQHVKFRLPQDYVVAVFRALGVRRVEDRMLRTLDQLRHPVWAPPSPAGFGDTLAEWADPDSLLNRAELARTIGRQQVTRQPPEGLLDVVDLAEDDPLRAVANDSSIAAEERLALALAGPAFQWR